MKTNSRALITANQYNLFRERFRQIVNAFNSFLSPNSHLTVLFTTKILIRLHRSTFEQRIITGSAQGTYSFFGY